jgi:hypothetical protein
MSCVRGGADPLAGTKKSWAAATKRAEQAPVAASEKFEQQLKWTSGKNPAAGALLAATAWYRNVVVHGRENRT